jgi:hypothetical protein
VSKEVFVILVKEYNRERKNLSIVKLVHTEARDKVVTDYALGLRECKEVVDKFGNYPDILWKFCWSGFDVSESHICMRVSDERHTWWEALRGRSGLKENRIDGRTAVKYYNSTLKGSDIKRKFGGILFRFLTKDKEYVLTPIREDRL